ncbi:MAG: 3'(2'),5'-bisphosphate nucleotidase CysQ [Sphingobium sp.]|nr:3'(2'),5'-bisphosphate nucleotidase CysQ [Sphingobium sp.]
MPASDDRLAAILGIADEAAAGAMRFWAEGQRMAGQWEKEPGQPVSHADLFVDALLRERLGVLMPEAAWLSEESAETPGRADRRAAWVVDPIDGTREFVRGRTGWAVSIALVEDGEVTIAVLMAPARGERWWAVKGQGAWRNGVRLRCGSHPTLSRARVPADHLRGIDIDYVLVPKPNSIALRMAMVAADEADAVASFRWGAEWDIAAASRIAQEAGAICTDVMGRELGFNRPNPRALGILCTVPQIHAAGVARLQERAKAILRSDPQI